MTLTMKLVELRCLECLPSARFANNLRDIFELINDRFDNGAFAGQQLIHQAHQMIFHVALEFGQELNAIGLEEALRQGLESYAHFWCMEGKEGRAYSAG